jgi:hypothetical protein
MSKASLLGSVPICITYFILTGCWFAIPRKNATIVPWAKGKLICLAYNLKTHSCLMLLCLILDMESFLYKRAKTLCQNCTKHTMLALPVFQ